MNQCPMIPPNFVSLRQLKEKRELEEKLKKEEEEEERLRKLKEKEDEEEWRLRRLRNEEEASKTLRNHRRKECRDVDPRRSADLYEHVAANGRPDHEGSKQKKRQRRSWRRKTEKGMTEMALSLYGSEKTEVIGSDSGPVSEVKKRVSDNKVGGRNPNPNRRGRRGSRNLGRDGRGDGVTKLPLSINGFGAPVAEKEASKKVTVDAIGSESGSIADIEKQISDLKLGGWNPNQNRRGRGWRRGVGNLGRGGDGGRTPNPNRREREGSSRNLERDGRGDGVTKLPLSINGFGALATEKEEVKKVLVEVIGSESGSIAGIKKQISDLKLGGWNPNQNRRGRGWRRGVGNLGHGGGGDGGGGMLWVKKSTKA